MRHSKGSQEKLSHAHQRTQIQRLPEDAEINEDSNEKLIVQFTDVLVFVSVRK